MVMFVHGGVLFEKKSSALCSQERSKKHFECIAIWLSLHSPPVYTSVISKMKNVPNTVNQTSSVGVHLPQEPAVVSALKSRRQLQL